MRGGNGEGEGEGVGNHTHDVVSLVVSYLSKALAAWRLGGGRGLGGAGAGPQTMVRPWSVERL